MLNVKLMLSCGNVKLPEFGQNNVVHVHWDQKVVVDGLPCWLRKYILHSENPAPTILIIIEPRQFYNKDNKLKTP